MKEPIYITQAAHRTNGVEFQEWLSIQRERAIEEGSVFFRVTADPERGLVLCEGWDEYPSDQGEPRWNHS